MIGEFSNHLWQSTLFALAAGLLTVAFRKNRAKVRYWLWLSASVKFLVPFTLLMGLGSHLEWAPAAKRIPAPAVSLTMVQITQPFTDTLLLAPSPRNARDWAPVAILVWACGFVAIALIRSRDWLRIRAAVRSSTPLQILATVEVRSSPGLLEPGVVGLFHPILLLPVGIVERLTPLQLDAILAHELCHVRRRDNLSAAVHMLVEAVFWFHPLVWWIGARLVEERERACDEEVVRLGGEPQIYAEAILNVCKYYLESPLVCVSGISGSDLKKRIGAILAQHIPQNLSGARKLLLAASAVAAVVAPIAIGLLNVPASPAQSTEARPKFEVASVKPSNLADRRPLYQVGPDGRLTVVNFTLKMLIQKAYGIKLLQISGGPRWIGSDLFDIEAKPEASAKRDQVNLMLQSLLAERFQLVTRRDTREMPVYALVAAKNGPKFKESNESDPSIIDFAARGITPPVRRPPVTVIRRGLLHAQEATMTGFAFQLSEILGRMVVDKTGLTAKYDLKVEWQPDENQIANFNAMRVAEGYGAPAPDSLGPSLFNALQEQLGLKLESEKGPVEMLVVERIERPLAN